MMGTETKNVKREFENAWYGASIDAEYARTALILAREKVEEFIDPSLLKMERMPVRYVIEQTHLHVNALGVVMRFIDDVATFFREYDGLDRRPGNEISARLLDLVASYREATAAHDAFPPSGKRADKRAAKDRERAALEELCAYHPMSAAELDFKTDIVLGLIDAGVIDEGLKDVCLRALRGGD